MSETDADADTDLLPIGRFARLAGLSVGALRHYDELGVLRPADVDRFTGYRRYRRAQLEAARTIARLRDLEMPIDEIRELLATDDPDERQRWLATHRGRVEARTFRLQRILHVVGQLSEGKGPIVSDTATASDRWTRPPDGASPPTSTTTPGPSSRSPSARRPRPTR